MGPIKRFSMILFRGLFLVTMLVAGVAGWTNQNTALAGNTDPWTVSEVNGKVWVDHDGTGWQALKTGTVIKRGSRVKTGMGGRAVLKRPGDSIASSPNSRFRIPTSDEKGAVAHFVQTLGTLLFKLKSRPQDPFNVRTPYLAAVVKGTTFTVTVDAEGAALHVSSGAVEVTSVLDGVIALIRSGQTAAVSATPGTNMRVLGAGRAGSPRRSPDNDTGKTTKEQKPEVKSDAAGASSKPAPKTTAAGRGTGGIFGERRGGNVARGGDIVITRQLGAPRINIGAVTKGLIKQSPDARKRAAKAAKKLRRHSRPAEEAGSDAAETAEAAGSDAAETAEAAGSDATDAAEEAGSDAAETAEAAGSDAAAAAEEAGSDATDAAEAAASDATDAAERAARDAARAAEDAAEDAADAAEDAADAAARAARDAARAAEDAAEDAADAAEEAAKS